MRCSISTFLYLILNLKKKTYIICNAKIIILQSNNRWELHTVAQQ